MPNFEEGMGEKPQPEKYTEREPAGNNSEHYVAEFWLFIWETVKLVIISLVIILPIRYYIAQPFFVKGASMEPSFRDGDYLIINEIGYRFSDPERGDVIVFRFPENPQQFFIKRIIGLPSETVEIRNNEVRIFNDEQPTGFILDESQYLEPEEQTIGTFRIRLDESEYFVLGDNRDASSDSRRWGPLQDFFVVGEAFVRAWPLGRFEKFESVTYPTE